MNIKDKKEDILQKIKLTTDEDLIEEVYELLYPNKSIQEIQIKNLPDDLQIKIRQSLDDYNNWRYITQDQMKKKVEQWLSK
jgi:hypothetical protein